MKQKHNLLGVVGWKDTGKTTLVAALVKGLSEQGYSVSTVKHAHHAFDIDHQGTDSHRHRQAGARETAIISATRWAIMHELRGAEEPQLPLILAKLEPCDLVIVEGYKHEAHAKLEVLGGNAKKEKPLWPQDRNIIALAGKRFPESCTLPCFDLDDIEGIIAFVIARFQLDNRKRGSRAQA